MKWGLFDWLKHVRYTALGYQPENMGKHADICTAMHQSSSGQRYHVTCHSFGHTSHHSLSLVFTGFAGARSISGCPVGPAFLSSHGSHPASRELKSCVSVEVFLNRGHVDVDGFLEQQFTGQSGHINHCGLIPLDGMYILPCILSYCRLLHCPFPAGFWVLPQHCLLPSSGLTNVDLAATARNSEHNLGPLLYW